MAFGQLRIEEMFAFVTVDEDGTEGIVSITKGGMAMPLVGADMRRVEQLTPVAKQIATATGRVVEILKFSKRTSVRMVRPGKQQIKKPPVRLEDKVTEAVGSQAQMEMRRYDEPQMAKVATMGGVVVHPTMVDGKPAVAFVFTNEDGQELPAIAVSGTTAKDIGPLAAAAYDMAQKELN